MNEFLRGDTLGWADFVAALFVVGLVVVGLARTPAREDQPDRVPRGAMRRLAARLEAEDRDEGWPS